MLLYKEGLCYFKNLMRPYHKSPICAAYHLTRWVFILFLCYSFFMPERVMGMEEDPYRFNTIKLGVDLTYKNDSYRTSGITSNTESFEQRYSLDVKGLLINPCGPLPGSTGSP